MFNLTTKPVSAGELIKKEKKPINFVVEKFISQGVHFLAGHPKSGKSWLSLWLALCVSNGNDLWGFKTNKSKVLYFCLEDTENRIQDRLEGMPGCDTDNLLFMYDAPNMDNGFDIFLKKIVKEEIGISTAKRIHSMRNQELSNLEVQNTHQRCSSVYQKRNITRYSARCVQKETSSIG